MPDAQDLIVNAEAMTGNITSELVDIEGIVHLCAHVTTATSASQDHAGTLYFRVTNTDSTTSPVPVALTVPTLSITAAALANSVVPIDCGYYRYLQVFYDRTSGGTNDTLTVKLHRDYDKYNA